MSHLSTTFPIAASPAVVFDLIADPARSTEWQTLFVEMGDIAGRPGGIGSSFVGFSRVAGRKIAGRFVVTAADRPTLFQVNGSTAGGWARWTTMIEAVGAGSRVTVTLEYELPGEIIGSLFGLLTGNRLEREFRRTYGNLKQLAETGVVGSPVDARHGAETSRRTSSLVERAQRLERNWLTDDDADDDTDQQLATN